MTSFTFFIGHSYNPFLYVTEIFWFFYSPKMFAARSLSVLRCFQSYFQVMHKITSSVSNSLDEDMKRHVKSKQYKQALELFKQSSVHTDASINMTLKACISLKDYEFGKQIEKQLSPSSQQNEFIQNSLFQLYSEFILFCIICIL